ncbi:MAG TPA: hypothetical protein VLA48_07460 [Nitrososphaeraceae archaeon]|jgi:hypothetical protein|nr:hypothetical protein [Nitrososphaeraceae archaeon]
MIISINASLEENVEKGITTLQNHIGTNNCPAVNKMLQLQIDTLQWVLQQKQNRGLESLKHVLNAKIDRLEYELKKAIRTEIEETNNIIYQLEMLKCCRIVINKDFNI